MSHMHEGPRILKKEAGLENPYIFKEEERVALNLQKEVIAPPQTTLDRRMPGYGGFCPGYRNNSLGARFARSTELEAEKMAGTTLQSLTEERCPR
eukprot:5311542-Pyramimonas_sp.AAC.1